MRKWTSSDAIYAHTFPSSLQAKPPTLSYKEPRFSLAIESCRNWGSASGSSSGGSSGTAAPYRTRLRAGLTSGGVSCRTRSPSSRTLSRCSVNSIRGAIGPRLYLGSPSGPRILGSSTGELTVKKLLAVLFALPLIGAGPAADSDWNQWRGPKRDGHSADTGLLKDWPAGGSTLAWKIVDLGGGLSSVSVMGDRIFTMGDQGDTCNIIALNAADGKQVWTAKVGKTEGGAGYPGPRCTPSVDGKNVIAVGQYGDLVCVDQATGKEKWRKHMESDFGGKNPHWGYAESPLIDGDNVVCIPGGSKGAVIALKKETGETVWQCAELKDAAAYTSVTPSEVGGKKQYLILTFETIA